MTGGRAAARTLVGVALVLVGAACTPGAPGVPTPSASVSDPAGGPSSGAASPAPPPLPPEQPRATREVAKLAASLDAVGSQRTGPRSMIVRVPPGAEERQVSVAGYTVEIVRSRRTAPAWQRLQSRMAADVEADPARWTAVGLSYEAWSDTIRVDGRMTEAFVRRWSAVQGVTLVQGAPAARTDEI